MMLRYLEQTTNFFGSWAPVIQLLKSDVFLKKTLKLSNEDIIGSGEYGTIYILTQDDTMAFAVKRLNRGSADRDRRFEREIEAMGDIKHRNIVTLNGYYTAPHYNLLIYELVAYEGLDGVLHGEWKDIVNNGIKIHNAEVKRQGRKPTTWKKCAGIPVQQSSTDCGYFIMRYMKDIVEDKNLEFFSKWEKKGKAAYTQQHIDEVRNEWAKFVVKTYM